MEQFVRFENPSGTSSEIHQDTDLLGFILREKGIEPLYSVFYKTKHPQCYDLFCKTPKTSSQESKEPLTLHFNFHCLKKPSQPFCLLLIVVLASFYEEELALV